MILFCDAQNGDIIVLPSVLYLSCFSFRISSFTLGIFLLRKIPLFGVHRYMFKNEK
jgi:hypothetical protein